MKVSPFCLHRFFATNVVQCVVYQIVAVNVKVNAGFAFTLNRLIYSLLPGEVKGEGKNGKFAECAGAYIRVGACPARRSEGELVWGREVLRETREEVAKSGEVLRESRLVFLSGVGEGEKNNLSCSVVYACFLILSFGFSVMAFCFRSRLSCFNTTFPILILRSGILDIFPSSFFVGRFFFFCSVLVSSHSPLYFLSRSPFSKKYVHFHLDSFV